MDATFVYMETPDMHAHVVGTLLLDPSTVKGGYSFEGVKDLLRDRIHLVPPFRRRLIEVPFKLAHPVWIEDPDFDLDRHVHRVGVPPPGTAQDLADFVGEFASEPLDRNRPLWTMTVVEGLEDGMIALVSKIHHAAIDGVSGADLMVHLFDLSPEVEPVERPEQRLVDRVPSDAELVLGALGTIATQPLGFVKMADRARKGILGAVRTQRNRPEGSRPVTLPFTAPKVPFNGAITPHRAVAFGRASLEDMKVIKRAFGTTVNDVVLAACTMSLRHWLIAHDALPDKPLVASCPVSVHDEQKDAPGTNKVSSMFVSLPVTTADPVEQLRLIHEDTKGAKELNKAMGADLLTGLAEFAPPRLLNRASQLYSRMNLADRHRPVHNLIISNVPGPPVPLYSAGARVEATYPMGPILEGSGLNLTVLSNMGNVDFGAMACKEMVPDLWDIAAGFADAVTELRKRADELQGTSTRGGNGATTRKPRAKRATKAKKAPKAVRAPAKRTD